MSLVTSDYILKKAQEEHYAVGAFNAENMEMVQAIISAAEELNAPVIIQTTPGTIHYASLDLYLSNVKAAANAVKVPVVMHLDHGNSFDLSMKALRAGYTSIMIDGSKLSFEDNIVLTKSVVDACKPSNVPVEGELGKVGGKEDDMESSGTGYTEPDQAVEFVKRTGVSSLAVGVGTAHGVYTTTPVLNTELISLLRKKIDVPLVLHGASGLSDEAVRECIQRGMCKVNIATELRIAFTKAVEEYLEQYPTTIDPKKIGTVAKKAVKELVMSKMKVLGCDDKA